MALREVNLVPEGLLYRRRLLRHLRFWTVCLCILLGMVGGYHFFQERLVKMEKKDVLSPAALDREIRLKAASIQQMKQTLDLLQKKHEALEGLSRGLPYSWILMKLSLQMNNSTWLKSISISRPDSVEVQNRIKLTGYAFENDDLGDFLNRLSGELAFDEVLLRYARETTMPLPGQPAGTPVEMIEFQIEFEISRERKA